jgi:hypothetical protein
MKKQKEEWVSLDEAIEHVMASRGCSRRTARRLLAKHFKNKEIDVRRVPMEPPFVPIPGPEAYKKIKSGEGDSVLIALDDFMKYFKMSWAETLAELQAGRLVAGTDEATAMRMEMGEQLHPGNFNVSYEGVMEWMRHPDTPQHLYTRRGKN